jgi:hypothetical protein
MSRSRDEHGTSTGASIARAPDAVGRSPIASAPEELSRGEPRDPLGRRHLPPEPAACVGVADEVGAALPAVPPDGARVRAYEELRDPRAVRGPGELPDALSAVAEPAQHALRTEPITGRSVIGRKAGPEGGSTGRPALRWH